VGAVVALSYVAAVGDPARFASSKAVGPALGLTHNRYQSGETIGGAPAPKPAMPEPGSRCSKPRT
jgi:transposase